MTNETRRHTVQLSPEIVAKCEAWAAEVAARYGGDDLHAMPWSRRMMTSDDLRQWLASREEAGRLIDIETCELGRWAALDADPYGIRETLGELPEDMDQIGTNRFARSPYSGGWVWEGDLPEAKGKAMYDRIHREAVPR